MASDALFTATASDSQSEQVMELLRSILVDGEKTDLDEGQKSFVPLPAYFSAARECCTDDVENPIKIIPKGRPTTEESNKRIKSRRERMRGKNKATKVNMFSGRVFTFLHLSRKKSGKSKVTRRKKQKEKDSETEEDTESDIEEEEASKKATKKKSGKSKVTRRKKRKEKDSEIEEDTESDTEEEEASKKATKKKAGKSKVTRRKKQKEETESDTKEETEADTEEETDADTEKEEDSGNARALQMSKLGGRKITMTRVREENQKDSSKGGKEQAKGVMKTKRHARNVPKAE
nr:protein FAM133-like [Aegilops tauschii subsp. strangulata]